MNGKKKIMWIDFTNVPHVSFLHPIKEYFSDDFDFIYSVRDFAETKDLFSKRFGINPIIAGKHKGQNKLRKALGVVTRIVELQRKIPHFDIKLSVGGDASSILAKIRTKVSVTFDDNEKAPNWRYSGFTDLAFWPKAISLETLIKQGFSPGKIFQYDGFKEDLYLADYKPDITFPDTLPFRDYFIVRPENVQANYVNSSMGSIVPVLLKKLEAEGINVLYLPRYEHDREYARDLKNIYIPEKPVNGLDACFYSHAVLTGAGTFAREAACLGIPAVSFYAGKELLTVDQKLIERGWLFFSRDTNDIIKKIKILPKRTPDIGRSANVKDQIISKLKEFFYNNL